MKKLKLKVRTITKKVPAVAYVREGTTTIIGTAAKRIGTNKYQAIGVTRTVPTSMAEKISREVRREVLRQLARRGGKARAAKYDKKTLSKWAKKGGRPRKKDSGK
jgi:hypothetical protein